MTSSEKYLTYGYLELIIIQFVYQSKNKMSTDIPAHFEGIFNHGITIFFFLLNKAMALFYTNKDNCMYIIAKTCLSTISLFNNIIYIQSSSGKNPANHAHDCFQCCQSPLTSIFLVGLHLTIQKTNISDFWHSVALTLAIHKQSSIQKHTCKLLLVNISTCPCSGMYKWM